jgi:serine protease inhibitor
MKTTVRAAVVLRNTYDLLSVESFMIVLTDHTGRQILFQGGVERPKKNAAAAPGCH